MNIHIIINRLDPHKCKEKSSFPALSKVPRHKVTTESDRIVPRILGTTVRQRLPSRPAALLLVKDTWHPLRIWLDGPQSRCERFTEEKNLSLLPGIKP